MRYLNKHLALEKKLRGLEREAQRLRHAQQAALVVPLEQPYQQGWIKTYVLDQAAVRRPDAQIFRNVLAVVNHAVRARNRAFVTRKGFPIVLRPRKIGVAEWRDLAWPASHQRFFAFGVWRVEDDEFHRAIPRSWRCGYKLVQTWWLREDIQPFLITHQRVELPAVRTRLAEIESFMARTNGWDRLTRLHGRRVWSWPPDERVEVQVVREQLESEAIPD